MPRRHAHPAQLSDLAIPEIVQRACERGQDLEIEVSEDSEGTRRLRIRVQRPNPRRDDRHRCSNGWAWGAIFAALSASGVAAQQPCVEPPLFSANVVIPMPPNPGNPAVLMSSVFQAIGDFNDDGLLDLMLGSEIGSLMYIRGRQDWWEFEEAVFIPLPFATPLPGQTWPITALCAADFDDDGKLDLAVGDTPGFATPAQRIHVMLGNGDGTFQAAIACGPDTLGVLCLRAADFNGDGLLDIGYGTSEGPNADTVGIAWGTGAGSFPTFTTVYSGVPGAGAGWIDPRDIDNDADIDAVVDCTGVPAAILRNNGNGTFATELLPPGVGLGYTFGEFNADGWADLLFATPGTCDPPNPPIADMVHVRLNDGAGQFLPASSYPITTQPCHTRLGSFPEPIDLNGDGRDELVIGRRSDWSGSGAFRDQVLAFTNAGNGSLVVPPVIYHANGRSVQGNWLTPADLNGDGRTDIVVTSEDQATLLLNHGDGTLYTERGTPMGPAASAANDPLPMFKFITPSDVNGDGQFDLVAAREQNPILECTVMLQDENHWFTTLASTPVPERFTTDLTLDDFNRDGSMDLAIATSSATIPCGGNTVRVAFGDGDGTFGPWAPYAIAGKSPSDIAAGDLNGDLWPDLVVAEFSGSNCPSSPQGPRGVSVLMNEQDGTFAPPGQYNIGAQSEFVTIADVNGDGHQDLAATWGPAAGPGGVRILLNNGSGSFTLTPHLNNFNPAGCSRVAFADVDGDSDADMLFVPWYLGFQPTSGGLIVALNAGDGTFKPLPQLDVLTDYSEQHVVAADLSGDGKIDIAVADKLIGTINMHLGNGDGTFGPLILYGGGHGGIKGIGVIVKDFDNDGYLDLGSPLGCSPDWDLGSHLGFAILHNRTCPACYPDCNGSNSLTIADFGCFQSKFVQQDPYADCNQTNFFTIADFACFQARFVQGCP